MKTFITARSRPHCECSNVLSCCTQRSIIYLQLSRFLRKLYLLSWINQIIQNYEVEGEYWSKFLLSKTCDVCAAENLSIGVIKSGLFYFLIFWFYRKVFAKCNIQFVCNISHEFTLCVWPRPVLLVWCTFFLNLSNNVCVCVCDYKITIKSYIRFECKLSCSSYALIHIHIYV